MTKKVESMYSNEEAARRMTQMIESLSTTTEHVEQVLSGKGGLDADPEETGYRLEEIVCGLETVKGQLESLRKELYPGNLQQEEWDMKIATQPNSPTSDGEETVISYQEVKEIHRELQQWGKTRSGHYVPLEPSFTLEAPNQEWCLIREEDKTCYWVVLEHREVVVVQDD